MSNFYIYYPNNNNDDDEEKKIHFSGVLNYLVVQQSCDEFLQKTRIHLHSISEISMTEMSNIFLLSSTTNALPISTSAKAFKLSRPGFPDRFKIDVH